MTRKFSQKIANLLLSALGILLFAFSDSAFTAAGAALEVCAKSVIPSLFPYMVLSGLIVRRGLLAPLYPLLPTEALFRLPPPSACPILLGALCGFPIGAKTASELYQAGQLSKEEAERTCAIANNTGPAFAVGIAGSVFWKSRSFGWYLYAVQLISAVIVGLLMGSRRGKQQVRFGIKPHFTRESPIRSFAESVSSAASAVIPLCGYIVFFSVLCAMIKELLPDILPAAVLCSVLEFTTGIREAAAVGGMSGLFLTGFALGFSGISVFVQSYCFTSQAGLSLRKTFLSKALQGVITGGLCTLFPIFFG